MVRPTLNDLIAEESAQTAFPAANAMADHLRSAYGSGVRAVVFYGSCLRLGTDKDLMLDFYVLVDSLKHAIGNPASAVFGTLLPPNVYYHEIDFKGRTVRAKVAVTTLVTFARGAAETTFASAIWARFAQPAAIVFASDDNARAIVQQTLTRSVTTLISKAIPLMTGPFITRDLWVTAFRATYDAELRPEASGKADELVDADLNRYDSVGTAALAELGIDPTSPRFFGLAAVWIWRIRALWCKALNILRLIKAAFTFRGGLDYAIWKMARHADPPIILTEQNKARPLVTGLKLLLKLDL